MMKQIVLTVGLLSAAGAPPAAAQPVGSPVPFFDTHVAPAATKLPPFAVKNPDKKLSPYTGLTRHHWQDAARYLLGGAFS